MAKYTSPLSTFNLADNQSLQNTVVSQQETIIALQGQLNNIQTEVTGINSGIQNIGNLIQRDSIFEQTKLLEEQKREKLLAERSIRIGKEKELEQRITSSLSAPLKNLEPRLTSVFDRVTSALQSLFFGFLGVGVVQSISNIARLGIKGLTNAKSLVSNALAFVGNSIASMRTGFNGVIRSIGNITKKITGIALNLAKSPVKFIADLFKKIPGLVASGTKKTAQNIASAGGGFLDDILKMGSKALPSFLVGGGLTALDIAGGEKPGRALSGAAGGMASSALAFAAGSLIPIPGSGLLAGALSYGPGEKVAKNLYDYSTTNLKNQSFLSNIENNFRMDLDPSKFFMGAKEKSQNFISALGIQNLFGGEKDITSSTKDQPSKVPVVPYKPVAEVKTQPPLIRNLNSLPEPKPDVIVASTLSQNKSERNGPIQTGPLTDVPLIPSANIDNFYSLYAQTHYNVVM